MKHGTTYSYDKGCSCPLCRQAIADSKYRASAQAKRRGQRDPRLIPHGTTTGYGYWHCRCTECTNANRVAGNDYHHRRNRAS